MNSEEGEFILSSPSYRIEKARLRYENLLLSLDDDINPAELHINENVSKNVFHEWNNEENYDRNIETESKGNYDSVEFKEDNFKSPIQDIWKSVTRRYVISTKPQQSEGSSHTPSHHTKPPNNFKTSKTHPVDNWEDEHSEQVFSCHDKDDIILAQQSEIESLKHELYEFKMTTLKENQELKMSLDKMQAVLQDEREKHNKELTKCRSDHLHFKGMQERTQSELDQYKIKLKESLRHLDRLTRRGKSMHSEAGSFSRFRHSVKRK